MTFEEWLEFYSPGTAFTEGEKAPLHAAWLAGAAQRPEVGTINVPLRLVELIREARKDGWYEDNPRWDEVDALLPQGGR